MGKNYFRFKQFVIKQEVAAMKVGTDGVLLGAWVDLKNVNNVLDIGTGSGIIALMIAQRCNANIKAVEIDLASAQQAKANFESSPWSNRLEIHNTSFQNYFETSSAKFDLLVSNPPYFTNSLKSQTEDRNLVRHTDLLPNSDLLNGVIKLLSAKGRFCAVFPYAEGNVFIAQAASYGLYCNKKLYIQSKPEKPILRILVDFSFEKRRLMEDNLSIHREDSEYTDEYKLLTKDFYLAF
ncbi:MAG: tRNA1(Val) (adenine(37)-N6)-methyltransferase [Tenuifilaceae bacterium]